MYCSNHFINTIQSVLEKHQLEPTKLVSGACHEGISMSSITDIGMGTTIILDVILKLSINRGVLE